MLKIVSSACAALMVLSVPFAAPAIAMPMPTPAPAWDEQAVINVQNGGPIWQQRNSPRWQQRNNPRWQQRSGNTRWRNDDVQWQRNRPYYRGHQGSRHYRQGWRQHNGAWFPPAAFIAGAIIGGALANQAPAPRYRDYGNAHVEWCYARYRSYREWDNTFQPYNGPRRQCASPYG